MSLPRQLPMDGLELLPSQVFGNFRLVPVTRKSVHKDLRVGAIETEHFGVVKLRGPVEDPGIIYTSYIPHGFVFHWGETAHDSVQMGGVMAKVGRKLKPKNGGLIKVHKRMVKREAKESMRIFPLHAAMEGFLACQFGGPPIAFEYYSKQAIRYGLSPRYEKTIPGHMLGVFGESLRLFERHVDQVGMLVFCEDQLVSAFVLSHPDDYAKLHYSLLEDFFCDQIYHSAFLSTQSQAWGIQLDEKKVTSLDDLANALESARKELGAFHGEMTDRVFQHPVTFEKLYDAGQYRMLRFQTDMSLHADNHLGECILDNEGQVQYLKTYRLSLAQTRRGFLLQTLGQYDWDLDEMAKGLETSLEELVVRLVNAGFDYLLRPDVVKTSQAKVYKKA